MALAWAGDQPWARAMSDCQQDAEWHGEGDVWTHTQMVCKQLPQLESWPALTQQERAVLILTGLFHDAAKPLTSRLNSEPAASNLPNTPSKGSGSPGQHCVSWLVS